MQQLINSGGPQRASSERPHNQNPARTWRPRSRIRPISAWDADWQHFFSEDEIDKSVLRLRTEWARDNAHLFELSPPEKAIEPNPDTITEGRQTIDIPQDIWLPAGVPDPRVIAGRTLRYWLIDYVAACPGSDHRVRDIVAAITAAGYRLPGRASKTVSDALHTETDRGRIERTGWGRYQLARPVSKSTAWRIRRTLRQFRNNLLTAYENARRRVESIWQNKLDPHGWVIMPLPSSGPTLTVNPWNLRGGAKTEAAKVANPTESTKKSPRYTGTPRPGPPDSTSPPQPGSRGGSLGNAPAACSDLQQLGDA